MYIFDFPFFQRVMSTTVEIHLVIMLMCTTTESTDIKLPTKTGQKLCNVHFMAMSSMLLSKSTHTIQYS